MVLLVPSNTTEFLRFTLPLVLPFICYRIYGKGSKDESSCSHLEMVKYLHSIGIKRTTPPYAIENDHLEIVKYLHNLDKEFPILNEFSALLNLYHFEEEFPILTEFSSLAYDIWLN